MTLHFIAHPLL